MRQENESGIYQYVVKAKPVQDEDVMVYLNKYGRSPSTKDQSCISTSNSGCTVKLDMRDISPSLPEKMVWLLVQTEGKEL